jgi:hypothetical protein
MQHDVGMKPTKSLRKQAAKAEAAARRSEDTEHAERMHNLAEAFRPQADALKAEKKKGKRRSSNGPNNGSATSGHRSVVRKFRLPHNEPAAHS